MPTKIDDFGPHIPMGGLVVFAQGEPNQYWVSNEYKQWVMSVQFNGGLLPALQESQMRLIANSEAMAHALQELLKYPDSQLHRNVARAALNKALGQ